MSTLPANFVQAIQLVVKHSASLRPFRGSGLEDAFGGVEQPDTALITDVDLGDQYSMVIIVEEEMLGIHLFNADTFENSGIQFPINTGETFEF